MTHSPTAAVWTTCSRSAGSGCPPANWRIASFNMKGCGKSALVGVKNADGLVKPCAFVVSDQASSRLAAELQAFAKSRLEPYKYPREVIFLEHAAAHTPGKGRPQRPGQPSS